MFGVVYYCVCVLCVCFVQDVVVQVVECGQCGLCCQIGIVFGCGGECLCDWMVEIVDEFVVQQVVCVVGVDVDCDILVVCWQCQCQVNVILDFVVVW